MKIFGFEITKIKRKYEEELDKAQTEKIRAELTGRYPYAGMVEQRMLRRGEKPKCL